MIQEANPGRPMRGDGDKVGPGAGVVNALACCIQANTIKPVNTLERTAEFDAWLSGLADRAAKLRIARRVDAAKAGNFGDCAPIGDGVSEMRVHYGPGYRVYFTRIGRSIYLLLAGGDKSSQERDIARALEMARTLRE